MKKIIIIVVVLVLLGGGGAAFFLLNGSDPAPAAGTESEQVEVQVEEVSDPIYLPLDPAFVVNFEHNGGIRYLQLSLQVMSFDQAVVEKVEANMPAVRNNLILLFSGQDYDSLTTVEGKEKLREDVRESINQLVHLTGSSKVNDVFFTGFVMQ
jgi:flagellar FliL protein